MASGSFKLLTTTLCNTFTPKAKGIYSATYLMLSWSRGLHHALHYEGFVVASSSIFIIKMEVLIVGFT